MSNCIFIGHFTIKIQQIITIFGTKRSNLRLGYDGANGANFGAKLGFKKAPTRNLGTFATEAESLQIIFASWVPEPSLQRAQLYILHFSYLYTHFGDKIRCKIKKAKLYIGFVIGETKM